MSDAVARYDLPDGSRWPTLECAVEVERMLRYGPDHEIRKAGVCAASVIHAYIHLIAHPAGTEAAIRKLRMLRREARGDE